MSEDILITKDPDGGTAVLTTNSPASHYGCPVLRIEAEDVDGDFGPADLIDFGEIAACFYKWMQDAGFRTEVERQRDRLGEGEGLLPAATIVYGWAMAPERTDEEREAARRFLCQWPEGPQLAEGGDL